MQNIVKNTAIKGAIPYGGIKEIAKRSNTSIFTVSRVIAGRSRNLKVLNVIKDYLSEIHSTNETIRGIINEMKSFL